MSIIEDLHRRQTGDILHYGVQGMRWGVQNKDMGEGIARGVERAVEAPDLETWELKDRVDRMKLESDYRKLTEEEETYAVSKAEAIKKAQKDKIEGALRLANLAIGTANGVFTLTGNIRKWVEKKGGA